MKTTAILLALLWASLGLHAATYTVDNAFPGANFSSMQTAVNTANAGDTLLIQPSPLNYGSFTVDKKIYLKGPGHRSGFAFMGAEMQQISFNGSYDSSTVEGLIIKSNPAFYGSTISYLSFLNNLFLNTELAFGLTAQHIRVEGNIFYRTFHANSSIKCGTNTSHSWLITNNIFMRTTASTTNKGVIEFLHPTSIFEYNTVVISIQGTGTFSIFKDSPNAVIRNNIFYLNGTSYSTVASNCSGCTFEYNLQFSPSSTLSTLAGTGNLSNVDPQFINIGNNYNSNTTGAWDYNSDFGLQATSSASTASSTGGQIGVLGGLGHFHPRGFSAVFPTITEAIPHNRIVPQGDSIIITVEAQRGGL